MSYSRKNVALVVEEYEKKRSDNLFRQTLRLNEVYELCPRVREIDGEISRLGLKIMSAATKGKDGLNERIEELRKENEALIKERNILLASKGFPSDYTDLKFECEMCRDTGYVGIKMCECFKDAVTKKQIESSGIGTLIRSQSFDTFSLDYYKGEDRVAMENIVESLKDYCLNFHIEKENLLLVGGTGLGKTHLSTAIANELIGRGYDVIYETAQNIFTEFDNDRFRNRYADPEPKAQRYLECELLIIDDLGAEAVSSNSVAYLYNLINTRLNRGLPTVASTNLTGAQIRRIYDDRITSRIFGEYKILKFTGEDIRRQKI